MKIYERAARRELLNTATAVFFVLFAVMLSTQLIRLLSRAAGGKIAAESVAALLGFGSIGYMAILLSLTLFISILLTISRWYRDSEMVIWLSSGMPLTTWVRPVLGFAAPIVFMIAGLSIFLAPWAAERSELYRQRMDHRDDLSRLSPGTFNESSSTDRVFFVEAIEGTQELVKNVFVSSLQHGRLGVIATAKGRTELAPNGDRFLVLENGRRYEGEPGSPEYRIMEFDRYAFRIEAKDAVGRDVSPRGRPVWELVTDPTPAHLAELLWRIGLPLTALNLALLAIPLAFVNPRAGRGNNLIFALLSYMIYNNFLSVSQAWVAQGKMPFWLGASAVHLITLVLLLGLFTIRQNPLLLGRRRWS